MSVSKGKAEDNNLSGHIKVWDIAVRFFHWSLVLLFAIAWLSAEEWDRLHEISGYMVGGLIAFRLIWGLVGTKYARFSSFIYRPSVIIDYLRNSLLGRAKRYIGHNPAGGSMVIVLLVSISLLTVSGIMMVSAPFMGMKWIGELHEFLSSLILFLIFLHVAGVLFASRENHENLIRSMMTGVKARYTEHK
ncbi:MAG: cytochrome b/b6 domain-containing protein [Hyphomicrobiaceae bacterium]|nr:cytochrome b/b6 domain-containing protein [Hyphomicrobiaceae bacterium]